MPEPTRADGTAVGDRPYLSIGEVLSLLREEFPDVTISKIRFLESQGLLDPERTPSGYRKFYEADVQRLRWILQQQRENFLPLKVIKGRLDDPDEPPPVVEAEAPPVPAPPVPAPPVPAPAPDPAPSRRPAPARAPVAVADPEPTAPNVLSAGETAVNMTFDELCAAADLPAERVRELEKFGLLAGRSVA